jgi:hypothetical protein
MNNLPDDCQGSSPHFPWNQEDPPQCPECDSIVHFTVEGGIGWCSLYCEACGYNDYFEKGTLTNSQLGKQRIGHG